MSKYNLHQLGWKAFEGLSGNIMQEIMGNTYALFSEGRDGGRDGYFEGTGNLNILKDNLSGKFVFQCKHTSIPSKKLTYSLVKKELPKLEKLVEHHDVEHYVIFTNYKLSANNDLEIKSRFTKIKGLKSCIILGDEWFESVLDANKTLRRLVPRLYGIGDLSEILDDRIYKQSLDVLDELKGNVSTFVSTEAYQEAVRAISKKRFVLLLGPPAVGKSAIATNLCMTSIVEEESIETLILEDSEGFKRHYNPDNPRKVFWFDDVFGATNLDENLLQGWIKSFNKLKSAIKKGSTIIFTSRDYIFNEAIRKIQKNKFPLLFDSQVKIDVSNLKQNEKNQILYNHIKDGDLALNKKTLLKPFLKKLAISENFSPELARRLGSSYFHENLSINEKDLNDFFSSPSHFFEEIVKVLDDDKKAALILILLNGNKLPSPVNQRFLKDYLMDSFDTSLPRIRSSLEVLKDSLVKLNTLTNELYWSFYHPSMIDSLQNLLSKEVEMLELFIHGSKINVLIRDSSCLEENRHKIYIPRTLWEVVCERIIESFNSVEMFDREFIVRYIYSETPDEFIEYFVNNFGGHLKKLITPQYMQFSYTSIFKLSKRLEVLGLLDEGLKTYVKEAIYRIILNSYDMSFLDNEVVLYLLKEEGVSSILDELKQNGPEHAYEEFEWILDNIEKEEDPDEYMNNWSNSVHRLIDELESRNLIDNSQKNSYLAILEKASEEIQYYFETQRDYEGGWHDVNYFSPSSHEVSANIEKEEDIFSDVDK
ncbi:restriction endonuclease [Rossellomorea sp. NPDC077527]|uniref:nSTAND3 domain-containing NTPase n=1 Tax=Rossellomorea sp. NPDC077527 TaxID=3364510 RepID=UPI0037C9EDE9